MKETEEDVLQKRDNDEIDLGPLFKRVDKAISKAAKGTGRAWRIIRLRAYIVALIMLFGIGAGVLLYMVSKPVYRSAITLSSQILPLEFCHDLIMNLNVLATEQSYELLAKRLNIEEQTAGQIASFEFIAVEGRLDSLIRGWPFKVEVVVYNNEILDELQPALVHLLENNEYTRLRKEKGIVKLEMLRDKLDREIMEMDSLKHIIAESIVPRGSGTGIVYGEPLDPVNIYRESVDLYERKLAVENELEFMDNIFVINDFLPKKKPDGPNLIKNIALGGAAGFLAGIFLVLLIPFRRE